MSKTDYPGIDYSGGRSNFDPQTNIHFGVISQNSVDLDVWSEAEAIYGDPACPKCGGAVKASDDETLFADYTGALDSDGTPDWFNGKDYTCVACRTCYWSDSVFPDDPQGYKYESNGYQLTDCLQNDIFVLKSPYYTYAQYCSPCVPGAGNLDSPCEDGPKTYCLGLEWFTDDQPMPYACYRVADDTEVR